jgi:hypothetical protein
VHFGTLEIGLAKLVGNSCQSDAVGFRIARARSMTVKKATIIIGLICFALSDWTLASCLAQAKPKEDKRLKQLDDETRKLTRTTNPENRAKSLVKIAEITLTFVSEAANAGDFTKMQSDVEQYRKAVTDARDTMMRSGLDPHKKSGGYKAVEIALRKQIRALQDIARVLTVDERQPVEDTLELTSKIRDEFVQALFGNPTPGR